MDRHTSGDRSGVGAKVESGDGDGRRKRVMTEAMVTEVRWHCNEARALEGTPA